LEAKQSPVFARTYDLIKWLVPHVTKYPKDQRFRLAKRIEDAAFDFHVPGWGQPQANIEEPRPLE